MSDDVQHPGRFGAAALLVGLLWYGLALGLASPPRPWEQFQQGSQLAVAVCFGAGVLVPAWLFRRWLAGARPVWALPGAAIGLALVTLCWAALLFGSVYLGGESVEEVSTEPTLAGKLLWSVLCVLHMAVQGVVFAVRNALLSLPLACGSWLCLRWASGGVAGADELRVAQPPANAG